MELTKQDSTKLKGLAALSMVVLHLFQTNAWQGLYEPLLFIAGKPLVFWFALLADCCVVIYCFCAGYAHALLREKTDLRDYIYGGGERLARFAVSFWVVVLAFALVALLVGEPYPWLRVLNNMTFYSLDMNAAWWFVRTYILLVLFSPILLAGMRKWNWYYFLGGAAVLYCIGYLLRFKPGYLPVESSFASNEFALFGTSLLPYVLGIVFYQKKGFSRLSTFVRYTERPAWLSALVCIALVLILTVLHGFVPSLAIAPLTGLGLICAFHFCPKGKAGNAVFAFLGKHSTNIWLTHMFFYMTLFPGLVFKARWVLPILLFTLALCVGSSVFLQVLQTTLWRCIEWCKNRIAQRWRV
jgi:hypothetical protein